MGYPTAQLVLVTGCATRIGELFSRRGDKLPIIASRVQCQFEHAKGIQVAYLAIRLDLANTIVIFATGADDKLTDTPLRISSAGGVLRRESLVVVVVAVEDHIHARGVQRLPDRLHLDRVAMLAGAEARVMPIGQRTGCRVRAQIGAQPLLLGRTHLAAADDLLAVAIEDNHVPVAEIIAIVASCRVASSGAEIREIARSTWYLVLMVPGGWPRAILEATP